MARSSLVSIIIPTYNERENIKVLIPRIFSVLKNAEIIVVDDNSPDGTADTVRQLGKTRRVKLIQRPKKLGIGSAYKDGFRQAKGDVVFEMDADLSHDPSSLPDFVRALQTSDVVVGSRYIPGGRIEGWGIYRKAVSMIANMLARKLLQLRVHDVTSGFRAYRRSALRVFGKKEIRSDGYSFQLEVLYRMVSDGCSVREIPIVFRDRIIGKSKLGKIKEVVNYLLTVARLAAGR
ncbi:MAG: polyprenol monophosphomannose synthase [Candidatus Aenigmarchaeota archaeon]|nr:polyprenol monophosphomannose synthase [Candidatus Aenigmarchaeota archaeon]